MDLSYPWEKHLPECPGGSSGYYAALRAIDDQFPGFYDDEPATAAEKRAYRRATNRVHWQIHTCTSCGTRTWPLGFRAFDPDWWWFKTLFWPLWRLRNTMQDRRRMKGEPA